MEELTKSLAGHPCLEKLTISNHRVAREGPLELRDMPRLRLVRLKTKSDVPIVGRAACFSELPCLEELELMLCIEECDKLLETIVSLPLLRRLAIY